MTLIKNKKNSYVIAMFSRIIIAVITFSDSIVISRYLGAELRGQYSYIINITNILVLIFNFGFYQCYFNYRKRKNIEDVEQQYISVITIQFLVYLAFSVVIYFITGFHNFIVLILIPFMIIVNQLSFFSLSKNISYKYKIDVLINIIYFISLLIVFLFSKKILFLTILILFIKQVFLIVFFIAPYWKMLKKVKLDLNTIKSFLKDGFIPMISLLLITLNYRADVLMLKFFVDYTQIGYYTLGLGLAEKIWIFSDACKEVLLSKSNINKISETVFVVKINLLICMGSLLFITIFGKNLITLLYGPEFTNSFQVTIILFAGTIFMVFFKLLYPTLLVNNLQNKNFQYLLISLIINIMVNLVLIPFMGINGSAFASLVSYSVTGYLFVRLFNKKFNTKFTDFILLSNDDKILLKKIFKGRKK